MGVSFTREPQDVFAPQSIALKRLFNLIKLLLLINSVTIIPAVTAAAQTAHLFFFFLPFQVKGQ